jgi:hypothetical protein
MLHVDASVNKEVLLTLTLFYQWEENILQMEDKCLFLLVMSVQIWFELSA